MEEYAINHTRTFVRNCSVSLITGRWALLVAVNVQNVSVWDVCSSHSVNPKHKSPTASNRIHALQCGAQG